MTHKELAEMFEREAILMKQKENFLKARQILSDKQNSAGNLVVKAAKESGELHAIEMAFQSFTLSGDIEKFMEDIKDTNYFGKR